MGGGGVKDVAWWLMNWSHRRFWACGLTVKDLGFLSRALWPWNWRSKWIQGQKPAKEGDRKECWGDSILEMHKDPERRQRNGGQVTGRGSSPAREASDVQAARALWPLFPRAATLTSLSSILGTSPPSHSVFLLSPAESTLVHKPLPKHPSLLFTGPFSLYPWVIHIACSRCVQKVCE